MWIPAPPSAGSIKRKEAREKRKVKEKERMASYPHTGLTYESRVKIRDFIKQMLERDYDKAMFENQIGFNKWDSNAMHNEFDGLDWWDDYTTLKHVHRFKKYRKQYLEMGFSDEDITPTFN